MTMGPSGEFAAHIVSQVAVLDNKILELHQERATLLQKLNHIRSPLVSRIPAEVLSRIFWFATRPYEAWDNPHKPYPSQDSKTLSQLRAVCSHWRRITESSPQLRTTLALTQKPAITSTEVEPADPVPSVQSRFLGIRKLVWDATIPDDAPCVQDFLANRREVEELAFCPSEWQHCINHHDDLFRNLTTLEVDFRDHEEDTQEMLYCLTVKQGMDNPFPHLQILDITTENASPGALIVVLHSRRNGPVDWSDPQEELEELILPPYDPSSTHWQSHTRLLEFSHTYDDYGDLDWRSIPHYDELEDMIVEAREVEGFDEEDPCYGRLVF